jgi:large subunit ribosomal protein L28
MALRPPFSFSPLFRRLFSSSARCPALSSDKALARTHANLPAYPHGPSPWYKQSNFGLYGLARIRTGNTVSERTETKNRRKWHPNVRTKRLWSDALGRFVRVRVLARVLRTIDKLGGLDEYLLGEKTRRVRELGMAGWRLRWRLMRTDKVRERFRAQRLALGLAEEQGRAALAMADGRLMTEEEMKTEERAIDAELERDDKRVETDEHGAVELGSGVEEEEGAPKRVRW